MLSNVVSEAHKDCLVKRFPFASVQGMLVSRCQFFYSWALSYVRAKHQDKLHGLISFLRCVGILHRKTKLSTVTVAALVHVTVVTDMAFVSFIYQSFKTITC